jgi:hypothetical protein
MNGYYWKEKINSKLDEGMRRGTTRTQKNCVAIKF